MTISSDIREIVRQRANFSCEYCGITETDTGDQLAIDHFQPQAKGGSDDLENLLYSCIRCNQYKLDYWPPHPDIPSLWNPRQDSVSTHFLHLDDGTLHPLTPIGSFTLQRLRLNRPALVAYRVRKLRQAEEVRLLTRYQELVNLLEQLNRQIAALTEEQRELLKEQRKLLRLLLGERD